MEASEGKETINEGEKQEVSGTENCQDPSILAVLSLSSPWSALYSTFLAFRGFLWSLSPRVSIKAALQKGQNCMWQTKSFYEPYLAYRPYG